MADGPDIEEKPSIAPAFAVRLARALTRARVVLLWERIWPPLAAMATVIGFFLAASWLGLWLALPSLGRIAGLVLFGVALLAAAFPFVFVRNPSRADALNRLDHASGLRHRPATTITDKLAVTAQDPVSLALWRAHVERALQAARALRAGWPSPRLAARDPYALRALVLILVAATFVAAGGERMRRIAAAFDWRGVVSAGNYRVDAWVTPPAYTGRPPVILPGLRAGEMQRAAAPVAVPVGSVLVIRATGTDGLDLTVKGGIKESKSEGQATPPAGTQEHRFVIQDAGEAVLSGLTAQDVTWTFTAIPDHPPTIALAKDPEAQLRGGLQLQYKVEDDYGVADARATFALKSDPAAPDKARRSLFSAPDFPLVLPQARARSGTAQTTKDLSDHPWAGAEVLLTLLARDEAENEGRSTPQEMRLPQRPFVKPLARALIEQRRNLALDAEAKPRVLTALNALTIAPERFTPQANIYLGLRSVYWQLVNAKSDDALRDVVARLWAMAVLIEDGNVSDAEAALRAAQEALRQALERGASDEEIKRLMDDLRAALDRFMQSLAEELRKNPNRSARNMPNARTLTPQDLNRMIDQMEKFARSGDRQSAQRMLEELQNLLGNLQTGQPQSAEGEQDDEMMSMLNELSDMIRKQQQLRDRTYREGQDQRRDRQRGQRGQNDQRDQRSGELRQQQGQLREQLRKMLEELRKRGQGQNGEPGEQGGGNGELDQLGRADDSMGDAEGQLGEGNAEGAVDPQGRALEALRRGAQGLAQSMQQQMGQGEGPGPGDPNGRPGQRRANNQTDPLGRPLNQDRREGPDANGRDEYGWLPNKGEFDIQRAQRVLEELRRRFSDPQRPQIELDYIERLLKGF